MFASITAATTPWTFAAREWEIWESHILTCRTAEINLLLCTRWSPEESQCHQSAAQSASHHLWREQSAVAMTTNSSKKSEHFALEKRHLCDCTVPCCGQVCSIYVSNANWTKSEIKGQTWTPFHISPLCHSSAIADFMFGQLDHLCIRILIGCYAYVKPPDTKGNIALRLPNSRTEKEQRRRECV